MLLCRQIFIDTLIIFNALWPFAYDILFVVYTHKSALSVLSRVLRAFLDFLLILNFICEIYLNTVWYHLHCHCVNKDLFYDSFLVFEFISFHFAMMRFTLSFLSIHDNKQRSNVIVIWIEFELNIRLPCTSLHYVTLIHISASWSWFVHFLFWFYFFRFN